MIITLRKIKQIKYFILFVSLWFHGSFCFRHPGIKIVPLHHVKGPLIVQKIIYIPISFTHFHDRLVNLKLVWRFFKKNVLSLLFVLISIEAAVAAFAQARAPGIYKGDYLKELFRRYSDGESAPPAPELPEWCFDDDDGDVDDDGNAVGQESGPSSSGSAPGKRKKEKIKLVRPLCSRKWTLK